MDEASNSAVATRPRWKRITDFPLVAMLIAIGLFVGTTAAASQINKALPIADKTTNVVVHALIALALMFAVYKLAIRRLGEVPRDDLPVSSAVKGLSSGLAFGTILFSLVVGIAALFDVYNIVGDGDTVGLIISVFAIAIVPGFMEELLFRGILFRWLEQFGGSWFALALTSALFGVAHIFNPNASALSSFAIAIEAGVLLGGAYMLTRNLWMPIGLHAAWNFTQGEIFDVPVSGGDQQGLVTAQLSGPELLSGGAFGLEASIIAMVVATAAGVWLVVMAIRAGALVRPWWVRRRITRDEALDPVPDPQ